MARYALNDEERAVVAELGATEDDALLAYWLPNGWGAIWDESEGVDGPERGWYVGRAVDGQPAEAQDSPLHTSLQDALTTAASLDPDPGWATIVSIDEKLPRWLIDDTAELAHGRVFVVHTQKPRLIGELLSGDDAEVTGIELSGLPHGQVMGRIVWIDEPRFDAQELCSSLADALARHGADRSWAD